MVHRDVKPGNVLLHEGGGKLSDLGLSQVFTPGVTLTGMGPIGSVEYMDPVLIQGEPPTPDNDIWSLGVMAHRVGTGVGVFGDLPDGDGLLALRRILVRAAAGLARRRRRPSPIWSATVCARWASGRPRPRWPTGWNLRLLARGTGRGPPRSGSCERC